MSCPNEYTFSLYTDGELPPAERQALEAHLPACAACRARVEALRGEAELLREVLHDRVLAPAPQRAPAVGLSLAGGAALAAAALVSQTLARLLAPPLPAPLDWLNPLEWIGGYPMLFETIFFVQKQGLALLAQWQQLGVLLSLLVVVGLLAAQLRRGAAAAAALALGAALLAPSPASALEVRSSEDTVSVAADENVAGSLVLVGESVDMKGSVDGDLLAIGQHVEVGGHVSGNVYALGEEIEISGQIDGALHVAGEEINVAGQVAGNTYGAGESLTLREAAKSRDVVAAGEDVHIEGNVARDLLAAGEFVEIRGQLGRNAVAWSERLAVTDGASIGGDLDIHTARDGQIDVAPGARIAGEKRELRSEKALEDNGEGGWRSLHFYLHLLLVGVAGLMTGLAFYWLAPWLFELELDGPGDFFLQNGIGLLVLIGAPILLAVGLATVVGIPLAIIGLFVYLTALFLALLAVSELVGRALWGPGTDDFLDFAKRLATGIVILLVALHLPYVGGLLRALALLTGLGLLASGAWDAWREREAND